MEKLFEMTPNGTGSFFFYQSRPCGHLGQNGCWFLDVFISFIVLASQIWRGWGGPGPAGVGSGQARKESGNESNLGQDQKSQGNKIRYPKIYDDLNRRQ